MTDSNLEQEQDQTLQLESVGSVTWTDDGGTTFRRTIEDGDILDEEIHQ